jgi:hypothetical protein
MGVQVNSEIPKMWTPLFRGARHYVHSPIGDRTMENLVGNTGKRSGKTAYSPRTDMIPAVKDTGMENKDTQEGT